MKIRLIGYPILIVAELGIFLGFVMCSHYVHAKFDFRETYQDEIRFLSKALIVFINIFWSLKISSGVKSNKIISGVASGLIVLLIMWGIRYSNLYIDYPSVAITAIFLIQILCWEILNRIKFITFKSLERNK